MAMQKAMRGAICQVPHSNIQSHESQVFHVGSDIGFQDQDLVTEKLPMAQVFLT